ncbi:MAG: hypothetical protein GY751_01375 [Bacteroidetes bacterium]|nr:hypothetical protein [Bacteroidota bacterium]
MKKMLILLLAILFVLPGCDDDTFKGPFDFTYSFNSYSIGFYNSGMTGVAQIDWNGETGTFGLSQSYAGVSVDNTNGMVSWNGDLPIGTTSVRIIATNSDGFATKDIELDHPFSGEFIGSYNYDPMSTTVIGDNFTLDFKVDGTLLVKDFTTDGSGTWEFVSTNTISGAYDYGYGPIYITGTIVYSESQTPYVEGLWGNDPNDINSGYYKVEL